LDYQDTDEVFYGVHDYKADEISGRRLLPASAPRRGGARLCGVVNWARSPVDFPRDGKPHNRSIRDAHSS
jgi:hypothetical protein